MNVPAEKMLATTARYEGSLRGVRLATRVIDALKAIDHSAPMTVVDRDALLKLRFMLGGTIDDVLEADLTLSGRRPRPSALLRQSSDGGEQVGPFVRVSRPARELTQRLGALVNADATGPLPEPKGDAA